MLKVDCGKCLGRGYIRAFSHIKGGVCFDCGGAGFKLYKNAPRPSVKFAIGTAETFPIFWRRFPNADKAAAFAGTKYGEEAVVMTEAAWIEDGSPMWDGNTWHGSLGANKEEAS